MIAETQPTTRGDIYDALRKEYTNVHHDLTDLISLLRPGDTIRLIRTSGQPAPSGSLSVTATGVNGVTVTDPSGTEWVIDPSSQEHSSTALPSTTGVAISGPDGATVIRSFIVESLA